MTMLRRVQKLGQKYMNVVPTAVGGFSLGLKLLPQYLFNKEEKFPRVPLGPFVTDTAIYESAPASGLRLTWMGHSSLLVEIDGVRILIDPVWDERASPMSWAGPKRFFAPPLALEQLPPIDAVLLSHDHYDHMGEKTIRQLAGMRVMADTQWITSLGVGEILRQFGVAADRIVELDWTEETSVRSRAGDATVLMTATPSRHFSGRSLSNRFETLWSSFVLKGERHTVYFGADSGWWEGFAEIGAKYGPFDLTMLEIGAYNVLWQDIHLGPDGAARAFAELGGGLMMPIHWGLFDLALHGWRQPIERLVEVAERDGIRLWSPEPGVPSEVVSGVELRSDWWR
jgi:L-ascorbate metabolism protein UlaG (beta-lactamase superfamily)